MRVICRSCGNSSQLPCSRAARQQRAAAAPVTTRIRLAVRQGSQSRSNTQIWHVAATPSSTGPQQGDQVQKPEDKELEGLLPEEDVEIPGNYLDALSSSTKLGKAVKAAMEELEHLGNMEAEVLTECDDLLRQLGMKGSLFGSSSDNPLLRLQQELEQQQALEEQQQQQQQEKHEQP